MSEKVFKPVLVLFLAGGLDDARRAEVVAMCEDGLKQEGIPEGVVAFFMDESTLLECVSESRPQFLITCRVGSYPGRDAREARERVRKKNRYLMPRKPLICTGAPVQEMAPAIQEFLGWLSEMSSPVDDSESSLSA